MPIKAEEIRLQSTQTYSADQPSASPLFGQSNALSFSTRHDRPVLRKSWSLRGFVGRRRSKKPDVVPVQDSAGQRSPTGILRTRSPTPTKPDGEVPPIPPRTVKSVSFRPRSVLKTNGSLWRPVTISNGYTTRTTSTYEVQVWYGYEIGILWSFGVECVFAVRYVFAPWLIIWLAGIGFSCCRVLVMEDCCLSLYMLEMRDFAKSCFISLILMRCSSLACTRLNTRTFAWSWSETFDNFNRDVEIVWKITSWNSLIHHAIFIINTFT